MPSLLSEGDQDHGEEPRTPGQKRWGMRGKGGAAYVRCRAADGVAGGAEECGSDPGPRVCTIASGERTPGGFIFFSMAPERVFVEAYAHRSGCRTRPRLVLRLRHGNHLEGEGGGTAHWVLVLASPTLQGEEETFPCRWS